MTSVLIALAVAGIGFQIPIDPEPANPEKSYWRKFKDSLKPRSRHLAERATVPVHRQNAAIKVGTSFEDPEVKHIEKVVSTRDTRLVITDNVIFVNNSGAPSSGVAANGIVENGTAEHPFDTIQEGTDMASTPASQSNRTPTVFVAGGGASYLETIQINSVSIHYASGGYGIPGYAGKSFGLGSPARLVAPTSTPIALGAVVEVNKDIYQTGGSSGSFWIDGFNLDGYVIAFNVHDVRIRGNRIRSTGDFAVDVEASAAGLYNVDVSDNLIESELGVLVQFGGLSGSSGASAIHALVNISDNIFNLIDSSSIGSGNAVSMAAARTNVSIDAFISRNVAFWRSGGHLGSLHLQCRRRW